MIDPQVFYSTLRSPSRFPDAPSRHLAPPCSTLPRIYVTIALQRISRAHQAVMRDSLVDPNFTRSVCARGSGSCLCPL